MNKWGKEVGRCTNSRETQRGICPPKFRLQQLEGVSSSWSRPPLLQQKQQQRLLLQEHLLLGHLGVEEPPPWAFACDGASLAAAELACQREAGNLRIEASRSTLHMYL
jgi:hypothetical protein